MRILYWTSAYWPFIGGMETHAAHLVRALHARGHDIIVVTSHGVLDLPDLDEHDGVAIHRFPFHEAIEKRDPLLFLHTQKALTSLKQQFRPDVVHVNPSDAAVIFHVRTASAYPAKVCVSLHIPLQPENCDAHSLVGTLLRSADSITTVSHYQRAKLQRYVPEVASITSVIENGTAIPDCAPTALPVESPRLLCVGRLVRGKGIDVAIEAFALVRNRWPAARLLIAGDGPERQMLESLAGSLGVDDGVEFLGWVRPDRVHHVINESSMVLVPSRWDESFPLVALEAAHMGRPVIASRAGGLPEIVVHGKTGILVEREQPVSLAHAIETLLGQPALAAQYGAAARERALSQFTVSRCVDDYEKVYRQLKRETAHAGAE